MCYDKDIILGHFKDKVKKMKSDNKFSTFDIFSDYDYYNNLAQKEKMSIGKFTKSLSSLFIIIAVIGIS